MLCSHCRLCREFTKSYKYGYSICTVSRFSPCDFAFPTSGVVSEATPNTEMTLISDVDVDLLKELRANGSVRNWKDRRTDLFELKWK